MYTIFNAHFTSMEIIIFNEYMEWKLLFRFPKNYCASRFMFQETEITEFELKNEAHKSPYMVSSIIVEI